MLSKETANALRNFILIENQRQKDNQLGVAHSENRSHILVHHSVPELQQASGSIHIHKYMLIDNTYTHMYNS